MDHEKFNLASLIPNLQNTEAYFDAIVNETQIGSRIIRLLAIFIGLTFFYGLVMGAYSGVLQAVTAAVKVPALFALSLIICYPAFFLLQFILGSKMKLLQMTAVIMAGFVLASGIMVSFTPIVVFFVLTGGNYHFLQLLHVAIFTLAGLFGMKMVLDALTYSCDKKNIYPKTGVTVFRFWVIILAFVAVQLAWNLRPFLAERDKPYALFRSYEGNFYTAVIYSFEQLIRPAAESQKPRVTDNQTPMFFDTTKER
ncbi:MAG TPA: hypothetical protein VLY03_08380 [Bacteroidota bacterium]|nr:hypothetical protein [Bacteroidota bacterium]